MRFPPIFTRYVRSVRKKARPDTTPYVAAVVDRRGRCSRTSCKQASPATDASSYSWTCFFLFFGLSSGGGSRGRRQRTDGRHQRQKKLSRLRRRTDGRTHGHKQFPQKEAWPVRTYSGPPLASKGLLVYCLSDLNSLGTL